MKAKIIHITELKRGDIFVTIAGRPTRVHEKHISGGQVMSWPDPDKFPEFAPGEMVARIVPEPVEEREFWRAVQDDLDGWRFGEECETREDAISDGANFRVEQFEIEHVRETVLSREEIKPDATR